MMILFLSVLISAGLLLPVVDNAHVRHSGHDDLEYVRQLIIDELMDPEVDSSLIKELMHTIRDDCSWPRIDYEDVSRTGFQHRDHVANLVQLARAYKKPASEFFGNDQLKEVIDDALGFWLAPDFIADNWHSNEIANPRNWASFMPLYTTKNERAWLRAVQGISFKGSTHHSLGQTHEVLSVFDKLVAGAALDA